jgi:predicted transposase/invertase (TIGR01784 family)
MLQYITLVLDDHDLNKYSQEDIVRFNDALSLVMLIDRIHTKDALSLLNKLPERYMEQMVLKIPEDMVKLISDVITVLLTRLEVPKEEIAAVTDQFAKKEYQTMFDALVESVLEDKRLARDEGRNEGRREGAAETALRMKEDGFTPQQIRKYTELSLKDIREIGCKS